MDNTSVRACHSPPPPGALRPRHEPTNGRDELFIPGRGWDGPETSTIGASFNIGMTPAFSTA
jgi:hypothetical protein